MKTFAKLILISLSMVCLIGISYGQDAGNFSATVLQMTNTSPGGSARIRGLGGAQTALGGDISSAYSNPAGLGFFNRSEFSFTPNFNYISSSADYLSRTVTDSKLNLNFANLGVVLNKSKSDIVESKWRGGSFGISINRIADFNNTITYEGFNFNPIDNDGNLILDSNNPKDFIESAVLNTGLDGNLNPVFNNDFAELAYNIGLTDIFEDADNPGTFFVDRNIYANVNGNLEPAFPEPDFPVLQRETIKSKGSSYQTSFSYGGNYADRVYFGAGLGIVTTDRRVERTFTEQPTETDLLTLSLTDFHELSGVGINATFGIIGRPAGPLLLGASYTTPTFHAMEQSQEITLSAQFNDGEFYDYTFTYEPFSYSVRTPSKLNAGLTYFFGKNGFITGDIEKVNFNGGQLGSPESGVSFSDENQEINRYESILNYRTGVEFRFDMFRVRGGFAYLGDPIDDNLDHSQKQVTFGGGIRTKKIFGDIGIISSLDGTENAISPYPGADLAISTTKKTKVAISIGWFF